MATTSPEAQELGAQAIGRGGLRAARWLEAHSVPTDLVATNVHAGLPGSNTTEHRQFWISGYAQRRVLLEGWAYIPPESVGRQSNTLTNSPGGGPFWEPEKLRLNDEAIARPTIDKIELLHERYGVDWLFVDRRYPSDVQGLAQVADLRYERGQYAVFSVD